MSGITRQLAAAAEVRVIDVPPVAGAALLGLDHVHAPAAAAARGLRHLGGGSVAGADVNGRAFALMTCQVPALPLPLVMPGALSLPNV